MKRSKEEEAPLPLREFLLAIATMGEQIPAEVRAKIPTDFAKNLDHYLYGHPKVD